MIRWLLHVLFWAIIWAGYIKISWPQFFKNCTILERMLSVWLFHSNLCFCSLSQPCQYFRGLHANYHPPTKFEEGNVFTGPFFRMGIPGTRSFCGGEYAQERWVCRGRGGCVQEGVGMHRRGGYVGMSGVGMSRGWVYPGVVTTPDIVPLIQYWHLVAATTHMVASGSYTFHWNAVLFRFIVLSNFLSALISKVSRVPLPLTSVWQFVMTVRLVSYLWCDITFNRNSVF